MAPNLTLKREGEGEILIALKTYKELESRNKVIDVWLVGLENVRNASSMLRNRFRCLIHTEFPGDGGLDFNHLRRVAKLEEVPESVRTAYEKCRANTCKAQPLDDDKINESNSSSKVFKTMERTGARCKATSIILPITNCTRETIKASCSFIPLKHTASPRLLIVCPVEKASLESLRTLFSNLVDVDMSTPIIISTSIPLQAPTSMAQAKTWTETHWPTIYKKNNPFGPHPSIVSRAQSEISSEISKWMELAWVLARESEESGRGEAVGVVVVERKNRHSSGRVISVAGDARWLDWVPRNKIHKGNPAAHAVMRAIALVARTVRQKKLKDKNVDTNTFSSYINPHTQYALDTQISEQCSRGTSSSSIFHEDPLSITERRYYDEALTNDLDDQKSYLCHGLEIYCTHEPCVMCSMAMVHSRFNRVIFEKRMFTTGGLTADGLLGYGLSWRKELNWTMLAWQWMRTTTTSSTSASVVAITEVEDLEA